MNVLVYFSPETLCNSYIVYKDGSQEAIIIDPMSFDVPLFKTIESKKLIISNVLVTHMTSEAQKAIGTLKRIYNPKIYSTAYSRDNFDLIHLETHEIFEASGLSIMPFKPIGRHMDSLMFRIEDALFPGDTLSAGMVAHDEINREILAEFLKELLNKFPSHLKVLPLFGPPSTVGIERETNADLLTQV